MRDALKSPNLLKSMMSSLTEPCVFLSPGSLATTTSRMSPDNPDRLAADSRYLKNLNISNIHINIREGGEEAEAEGRGRGRREPS